MSRDTNRTTRRALVGILVAGALLRLLLVLAWKPAFFGWPDAASYIGVSQSGDFFRNELRPAGFPLALRGMYEISPTLLFVVLVHHALGLASAALMYFTVVRTGISRWLALLPAAVMALAAPVFFMEHSANSEALFVFVLTVALYCGVRTTEGTSLWWPALGGLALATAASVRVVALPILILGALWLVFAVPGAPWRRRAAVTAVGVLGALALLVPYYVVEYAAEGRVGLSRNGAWNIYGRVAPFADCSKFTPPRGTEVLCENAPRSKRPYTNQYTFNWYYSPAIRYFGDPHTANAAQTSAIKAFTWEVVTHQPLDYLEEVGGATLRYIAPESFRGYGGGYSWHDLVHHQVLFNSTYNPLGLRDARPHYTDAKRFHVNRNLITILRTYESGTRIQGPLFVLLALLSFAAPFLTRGRARWAAVLFAISAWVMLVVPVATVEFSSRTAVPALGPFVAAAAIGAQGAWAAFARRRARRSALSGDHQLRPAL
jgi:4-amino-4-deoxy-L-arabinose transferase-like glycosyltransferase